MNTPAERGHRGAEKTEAELYKDIRKKRSDFFTIAVHVAIIILVIVALFSTLVSNTNVAPYITSIWLLPLMFFIISQGYYATLGTFNAFFLVGIVVEIVIFLYIVIVVIINIIIGGSAGWYIWSTLVVYALLAFLNFLVWLAYIKVLVTLYQIRAMYVRLSVDYGTQRIRSNITPESSSKVIVISK